MFNGGLDRAIKLLQGQITQQEAKVGRLAKLRDGKILNAKNSYKAGVRECRVSVRKIKKAIRSLEDGKIEDGKRQV